ncbi:PIR Superfamily Protein [Plasmodium ovale curtisi]|uniref:PIR Superfamily Protein n=1 Tax=Plasmodium ovale curtisi TaxID=864141 RepID=A0A1A8X941_PLAOA|nr:PIR Superfamily Protein [Plasmodium ovale curtisi]
MADEIVYKDDDMHSLPSIRNYYHFDNYKYEELGNIETCKKIQTELNDYIGIENLCTTITGILNQFNKKRINPLFDDDHCAVFDYWMYYKLFNNVKKLSGHKNIAEFIVKILNSRTEDLKTDKCSINQTLNVEDYFNKTKMLYDYALDYSTIKLKLQNPNSQCSQQYNDYIDKHAKNYKTIKSECTNGSEKLYCKLLEKLKKKSDEEIFPLLRACKLKSTTSRYEDKEIQDVEEGKFHAGVESSGNYQAERSSSSESEMLSQISLDPLREQTSVHSNSIPMVIAFPFFGIILILFILYKFTPFGTWLNVTFLKKKKIQHYLEEEEEEIDNLIEQTSNLPNISTQNDAHRVSYHAF